MISDFFWDILYQGNFLFYSTVSFVVLNASTMYSYCLCARNNKVHDHLTLLLFQGGRKSGNRRSSYFSVVIYNVSYKSLNLGNIDTEGVNDAVVAVCRGNGQWSYGYGLFHHRSIFLVGSISSGKKAKELEVGSGYIGWTVGHTWRTCANVLLMTGNYDQGYRNTKQSRPSVLWLT